MKRKYMLMQFFLILILIAVIAAWTSIRTNGSAGEDAHDSVITTKVEPLRSKMNFRLQEPKAPFQNAISLDWQKEFDSQPMPGAFGSGIKSLPAADDFLKSFQISAKTYQGSIQLSGYVNSNKDVDQAVEIVKKIQTFQPYKELSYRETGEGEIP
jgi:hypothetical protein